MRLAIFSTLLLAVSLVLLFFLTTYRSAFEADQACHFAQIKDYGSNSEYGCDHDIETSQWLLYLKGSNDGPAKVVKRFRY
ncbi:hypothetical protein [Prochlorococcus sp. MIT 1300]|uniref:hypothetical protein n=1 Tax=Prochlorococcus sp. MIT 1300 TaxID=3096218 RepID=UPI002A757934|nr:hypothetical protein [Prochlorococcus sp. MIT 1300]